MFTTSEQLTEDAQPCPLVLSEIRPNTFLALLEFIYTNCCSLSTDMVSSILLLFTQARIFRICVAELYIFCVKWHLCFINR